MARDAVLRTDTPAPAAEPAAGPSGPALAEGLAWREGDTLDRLYELVNVSAGSGDCFAEAHTHTQAALRAIGDGPSPIVVGGIGDSGTRGVQMVLSQLGVDLGYFKHPGIPNSVMYTYDSWLFMRGTDARLCSRDEVLPKVNAHFMYSGILEKLHSISYNESAVGKDDIWYGGLQFVGKITQLAYAQQALDAAADPQLHPRRFVGFKHPRTALVLPFFQAALGSRFKFVHVMRDGRDVANGRNKRMFRSLCDVYMNKTCDRALGGRLEFWAALNLEIFDWATAHLGPGQYYVVRIEDLIAGDRACLQGLAQFVGMEPEHIERRLKPEFVSTTLAAHRTTYSGLKWSRGSSARFTREVRRRPDVMRAFERFGYVATPQQPWARQGACLQQPFGPPAAR